MPDIKFTILKSSSWQIKQDRTLMMGNLIDEGRLHATSCNCEKCMSCQTIYERSHGQLYLWQGLVSGGMELSDRVIHARGKLDWMKNLNVERGCVQKPLKIKINLKKISREKKAHLLNNSIKQLCKENDKNQIMERNIA